MNWKTNLTFVALATLLTLFVGWLTSSGVLPIARSIDYSQAGLRFIQVWIWLAIAIGIVIPSAALFIWRDRREAREILGFYLLVLGIQIVTEQIIATIWIPSLVVTIGTIYTVFRVWQLWQGQQSIAQAEILEQFGWQLKSLLWLLLLFWTSNLIQLLTLAWPTIWF